MASFASLPITGAMLDTLRALKYRKMTAIQEQSIQLVIDGLDVLAEAKTGSGKTAAFGIGLLHKLDVKNINVQSLIICPTRELASQVTEELRKLAQFQKNIKLVTITGGVPQQKQEQSLRHGAHIVVGTPGRILALLKNRKLYLKELKTVVMDEADRLLDLGFGDQITSILKMAPKSRQTLLFSATYPDKVKEFALASLNEPHHIKVDEQIDTSSIKQTFYWVEDDCRDEAVLDILAKNQPKSTIVFCNKKETVRAIEKWLSKNGVHCLALHGDLDQRRRNEVLVQFSNGSSRVLVATDVAARGLDIDELSAVINCDLPLNSETYIHRIGRTGRAGREGVAYSLVAENDESRFQEICEILKKTYNTKEVPQWSKGEYPELLPEMGTVSIEAGRKEKISAGHILGALTAEGGIPGDVVGTIDRQDSLTFLAIEREYVQQAFEQLQKSPIKGELYEAKIHS